MDTLDQDIGKGKLALRLLKETELPESVIAVLRDELGYDGELSSFASSLEDILAQSLSTEEYTIGKTTLFLHIR